MYTKQGIVLSNRQVGGGGGGRGTFSHKTQGHILVSVYGRNKPVHYDRKRNPPRLILKKVLFLIDADQTEKKRRKKPTPT